MLTSRQYEDAGDLALMQALVRESWHREKPYVPQHTGDLDWWMHQHEHTRSEAHERIRLWFERDELVGWAWLNSPAILDIHLHPDHRSGALLIEMLDWLEERARAAVDAGTAVSELSVHAIEHDTATVAILEQRGYSKTEQCDVHTMRRLDGELPEVVLPDGFTVRNVRGVPAAPPRSPTGSIGVTSKVWTGTPVTASTTVPSSTTARIASGSSRISRSSTPDGECTASESPAASAGVTRTSNSPA